MKIKLILYKAKKIIKKMKILKTINNFKLK